MAASVLDVFMLFGDSITQGGWQPGLDGFGQRLSCMCIAVVNQYSINVDDKKQMFMLES